MLLSFKSHGQGSGGGAVGYLQQAKDSKGEVRAEIETLRGNPEMTAQVIDSLDFEWKYTSGVMAWAPEDNPTPEQISESLDKFETVAFAGLQPDQYSWTAIKHADKDGGVHVHILAARVELSTGKSLNIAPPGWEKDYGPLVDHLNALHDWADPGDPARARLLQPGHQAYIDAGNIRQGLKVEPNTKALLTDYITGQIERGTVKDRQGVRDSLAELGEITREGKNFISVKLHGEDKAVRLKGGIFEKEFNVGSAKDFAAEDAKGPADDRADREERISSALQGFKKAVKSRTDYNHGRYPRRDRGHETVHPFRMDQDRDSGTVPVSGSGPGKLGGDDISHKRDPGEGQGDQETQRSDQGLGLAGYRSPKPSGKSISNILPGETGSQAKQGRKVGDYPATEIGGYMRNSNTEINDFKSEIDLGLYLEAQGWQRDNFTSCKSSALYRHGEEKVLVGIKNNHFLYTNPDITSDKGSIIDFIQKRTGQNLGQVRKTLRPALNGDFESTHEWTEAPERLEKSQWMWANCKEINDPLYLEGRGLDIKTLDKYQARIKQTTNGQYMFGHYGPQGFTGFEIKSEEKGRFSAGCEKSLFTCLTDPKKVTKLVITETALDALSYAQMDGCKEDTAYISLAGNPSPMQLEQLKSLALMDRVESVVLGHDNDDKGHIQADKCKDALAGVDVGVERGVPAKGKDWNELLQINKAEEKEAARQQSRSEDRGIER